MACFSIVNGPHLDASVTSENIFISSSIDTIILILDASLVLEDFLSRSRIPPII